MHIIQFHQVYAGHYKANGVNDVCLLTKYKFSSRSVGYETASSTIHLKYNTVVSCIRLSKQKLNTYHDTTQQVRV